MADAHGWDTDPVEEIYYFRRNELVAVLCDQGITETSSGRQAPLITTKGCDVNVFWKDKYTNWIPLVEIKESNPIEVAEAATAFKHDREPAFNWWVQKAIKKRDQIIGKLHVSRCRKGKMKFGTNIPGTVKDAVSLDEANGNTLWQDAIKPEMKNLRVVF